MVSPVSINFCIVYLFLVNGPHALYVNPGCFKCISGINFSPANKNILTNSFILNWNYLNEIVIITIKPFKTKYCLIK